MLSFSEDVWPAKHCAECHWPWFQVGGGEAMQHPTFGLGRLQGGVHKETEQHLHGSLLIRSTHWLPCRRAAKENKTTIKGGLCHGLKGFRNI